MNNVKKILCISRHAPYDSAFAREALDATLAASVFDQKTSLLFIDDGVFQLVDNQKTKRISQKNISKTLTALTLYGVDNIYIQSTSLIKRNLTKSQLILRNIQVLDDNAVKHLLNKQDQILSF